MAMAAGLLGWPIGLVPLRTSVHATRASVPPLLVGTRSRARRVITMVADDNESGSSLIEIGRQMRQETRLKQALSSFVRVGLPTVGATLFGLDNFDNLSLFIRSSQEVGALRMLLLDDAQFVQNFLTVTDLLLAILAGNIYDSLYRQQEAIYFSLFREVSEAKALVEQLTLVGQVTAPASLTPGRDDGSGASTVADGSPAIRLGAGAGLLHAGAALHAEVRERRSTSARRVAAEAPCDATAGRRAGLNLDAAPVGSLQRQGLHAHDVPTAPPTRPLRRTTRSSRSSSSRPSASR